MDLHLNRTERQAFSCQLNCVLMHGVTSWLDIFLCLYHLAHVSVCAQVQYCCDQRYDQSLPELGIHQERLWTVLRTDSELRAKNSENTDGHETAWL